MSRPAFARAAFAFYRYPLYAYGYSYKTGTTLVSSLSIGTGISTSNQVNTTFDYTYNNLGYITNIKKNGTTIASYGYDSLGQMISESNAATGEIYIYTYDKAGNITKKDIYVGDIGNLTDSITYTYGNTAWKDRLTNYDGNAITYDSIGNPTKWGDAIALNWDGRNLVKTVFASNNYINYTYNSDGIRTRKYEYNGAGQYYNDHTYVLDGSTIVKETIAHSSAASGNSTTMLEYYYDESGVSSFRYNGTLYYYVKNLQGDVIGIMDSSGVIVVEYAYDAWGKILSVTGTMASTLGQVNPFRYRGYYYDTEIGLYYLNSRYYDADVGRFINADAYASTGQGIIGNNMFAYCLNNPVMFVDHTGAASSTFSSKFAYTYCEPNGSAIDDEYLRLLYQTTWVLENSQGIYGSELEAAQAWEEQYKPLSKDYEYVAYIFKIDTILGERYYLSETLKGNEGNVIPQVLYLEATKHRYIYSRVAMIHTHPNAATGKHNDFPSMRMLKKGGDQWAMFLFKYNEMYVVPYKRCKGTPEIISYNNKNSWCSGHPYNEYR